MSTNNAETIRRQIAVLLGYQVKARGRTWDLIRPDGTHAINFGADWAAWLAAPDWTGDLNAAIRLITDDGITDFSLIRLDSDEWHVGINTDSSNSRDIAVSVDKTPALAICRAWLDWRGKQS